MDHTNHPATPPRGSNGASAADALLSLLDLQPGMRALEVGCGQAEFAIRLLEIFPSIEAVGLDASAHALAQARERAKGAGVSDRLTLIESSPSAVNLTPASFDAALCIGVSQQFDAYGDALRSLATWVRPGGLVLIAEGYWQHAPDQGERALAEAPGDLRSDRAGVVATAEAIGLAPLYAIPGNDGEDGRLNEHKLNHERAFERYIAAHPDDADALAARDHVQALCSMYLRFGREMLGDGWYLFWRG
jgi:SAM-dependent methyltransferase